MRKFMMTALLALSLSHSSFAADLKIAPEEASTPSCETIAKACLDAGFSRTSEQGQGKAFWHDCMKPVLLGSKITGVDVDAQVVRDCRQFKIKNLQEQLDQLKKYDR